MLLVYTHKITNRVRYVFKLMLGELLGIEYNITSNADEFLAFNGPKLNYSLRPFSNEAFICSANLLFENGISDQPAEVSEKNGDKIIYLTGKLSPLPYDPFAAAFFLVSRYEEYLPHLLRDPYGRFEARNSLAEKNGFLGKPVVNIWARHIKEILLENYPNLPFSKKKYSFISTIDIDNAYAYREKGFMRSLGGFARAAVKTNFPEISERIRVLLGREKDPYDTYDYQLEIHKKYNAKVVYFFLLGDYGVNDKNLSPDSPTFHSLIKRLADYAAVGIHPSFNSYGRERQLKKEIGRLSGILHCEITRSRQHFLRLRLPETYRSLIELDIKEDYTMGYASRPGFRAGICSPFTFYDIDMETETPLRIIPFAFMEGTLKYYMNIAPENAMEYIKPLVDECKAANGTFVSLWHNDSLNDKKQWTGWRKVYEDMLEYASA